MEVETYYQVTDDLVWIRLAWRKGAKQRFQIHFGAGPTGFADGIGSMHEEGKQSKTVLFLA